MTVHHGGPDSQGTPPHDSSTNSNACGPCPDTLAAVRAADATCYPDPAYASLRQRLADFHGVAVARVVPAASASEFIQRMTIAAARAGVRAVQLPLHAYVDYAGAAQTCGFPVVVSTGTQDTGDIGHRRRLVWQCDPSSPLGQAVPGLARAIDSLASGDTCVLDLAYEPLRLQGALGLGAARRDRVWQLWTPNKALGMTGVRAAYAIAPAHDDGLRETLEALAASWPIGAHGVALLESWTRHATQRWLATSRATLDDWKASQVALCEEVLGWRCLPGVANFFCARLPHGDAAGLCAALRPDGIKLRDTASFGLPGHVRLAVLPPASQAALRHAAIRARAVRA